MQRVGAWLSASPRTERRRKHVLRPFESNTVRQRATPTLASEVEAAAVSAGSADLDLANDGSVILAAVSLEPTCAYSKCQILSKVEIQQLQFWLRQGVQECDLWCFTIHHVFALPRPVPISNYCERSRMCRTYAYVTAESSVLLTDVLQAKCVNEGVQMPPWLLEEQRPKHLCVALPHAFGASAARGGLAKIIHPSPFTLGAYCTSKRFKGMLSDELAHTMRSARAHGHERAAAEAVRGCSWAFVDIRGAISRRS